MTSEVAAQKLVEYGRNCLSEKKKTFWLIVLLHEFVGFFGLLLSLGGALCFLAYGLAPADPSTVLHIINASYIWALFCSL
jgi:sodium/potassium-transporting ATPase subunit alpha